MIDGDADLTRGEWWTRETLAYRAPRWMRHPAWLLAVQALQVAAILALGAHTTFGPVWVMVLAIVAVGLGGPMTVLWGYGLAGVVWEWWMVRHRADPRLADRQDRL